MGWRAGVSVSDGAGTSYTPPVIIAAAPDRNYSDTDLVRLTDGCFLAVSREHVTKESVFAVSADEGATWTPIRPTGFKGANIKLYRLRSGLVLSAYRDEDPARRGVSCSVSADGGASWRFVGQLYVADPAVAPPARPPLRLPRSRLARRRRDRLCPPHLPRRRRAGRTPPLATARSNVATGTPSKPRLRGTQRARSRPSPSGSERSQWRRPAWP